MMKRLPEKPEAAGGMMRIGVFLLVLLAFLLRIPLSRLRFFDPDEFEHLHFAWAISAGQLPYRDFFEHHLPLYHYLLQPLFWFSRAEAGTLIRARLFMLPFVLGIFFLTYRLGVRLYNRVSAFLAVFLLSFMVMFLDKTIEIRPDTTAVFFWLLSLLLLTRGWENGRPASWFWAGVFLSAAFLNTIKIVFGIAGVAAAGTIFLVSESRKKFRRPLTGVVSPFLSGFLLPLFLLAVFFWWQGGLRNLIDGCFILHCADRFGPFVYLSASLRQNRFFWILAVGGLIAATVGCFRERDRCSGRLVPLLSAYGLAIGLFIIPVPFRQYYLLFLPLLAIYGGEALRQVIAGLSSLGGKKAGTNWLIVFILGGFVVQPIGDIFARFHESNREQLAVTARLLELTSPADVVFDGSAVYVFRPAASYHHDLHRGFLGTVDTDALSRRIQGELIEKQCKVMVFNERVRALPEWFLRFLRKNYVPLGFGDIQVAGRILTPDDFAEGKATFDLIASARYRIDVSGGDDLKVRINGGPYREFMILARGANTIDYEGYLEKVTIAYCPENRAGGESGRSSAVGKER